MKKYPLFIILILFSIFIFTGCTSRGIKSMPWSELNGSKTQNKIEYKSQPTTNTLMVVQPERTVVVEVPEEYIKKNVDSNNTLKVKIEIPAFTNTIKLVQPAIKNNESKSFSGSFLVLYYGSIGVIVSLIIYFVNNKKKKTKSSKVLLDSVAK